MACPDPLTLLKCLQSISHLSTACPDPLTLLKCLQSISNLSTACPDPLTLLKCLTTFKLLYVFRISKLKHFKTHNHRPFNTSHNTLTKKKLLGTFFYVITSYPYYVLLWGKVFSKKHMIRDGSIVILSWWWFPRDSRSKSCTYMYWSIQRIHIYSFT